MVDGEIGAEHPGQPKRRIDDIDLRRLGCGESDVQGKRLSEGISHKRGNILTPEGRDVDPGEIHAGVAVGVRQPGSRRHSRKYAGASSDLRPAIPTSVDVESETGRPEHLAARGSVRPVAGELMGEAVVGQRFVRKYWHVGPQSEVQAEPRTDPPVILGIESHLYVIPCRAGLFDTWYPGMAQEVAGGSAVLESLDAVELVGTVVVLYEQVVEGYELVMGPNRNGMIRLEQLEIVGELESVLVQCVGLGKPLHAEPHLAKEPASGLFEIDLHLGKRSGQR